MSAQASAHVVLAKEGREGRASADRVRAGPGKGSSGHCGAERGGVGQGMPGQCRAAHLSRAFVCRALLGLVNCKYSG